VDRALVDHFFLITLSSGTSHARIRGRILIIYTSYDAFPRTGVPFGVALKLLSILGVKTQKTFFGAWIDIFKLNVQNIKTCILSKLLHRFQPNFAQWQRLPNTLHGWSKQAYKNPRWWMAAILKNWKMAIISETVWPIGTTFGMVTHIGPPNLTTLTIIRNKTANIISKKWLQFLSLLKAVALKQQISKFYPQILSTEASCYIYDRPLTKINVIARLCAKICG